MIGGPSQTSGPGRERSGYRESWFAGLALGAGGGFLMLEFPLLGIAICVVAAVIIWRKGRAIAGADGLFVGIGGIWVALFGRVAVDCRADSGCTAPDIGSAVAASAAILAVGALISTFAALLAHRGGASRR